MHHRFVLLIACLMAALVLSAAPAFAGKENGTTTTTPSDGAGAAPVGGVATGAGGTADQAPSALELGLGGGAAVLLLATGGFVLSRRVAGDPS